MKAIALQRLDQRIAAADAPASAIEDPWGPERQLRVDRLRDDSPHLPFLLLHDEASTARYLVFATRGRPDALILWSLDAGLRYKSQFWWETRALASLLAAFGVQWDIGPVASWSGGASRQVLQEVDHALRAAAPTGATALRDIARAGLQQRFVPLDRLPGPAPLLAGLHRNWIGEPESWLDAIRDDAGELSTRQIRAQYERLAAASLPDTRSGFLRRIAQTWRTSALRELHALHTRRLLCWSPFSARHVAASRSVLVGRDGRAFRLSLIEDRHCSFIEIAGQEFAGSTSGFILPLPGLAFVSAAQRDNPSCWFKTGDSFTAEFLAYAIDRLLDSPPDVGRPSALQVADIAVENLGHTLWNFFPGVANLRDALSDRPDLQPELGLLEGRLNATSGFSTLSYSALMQGLARDLEDPPPVQVLPTPEGMYCEQDHRIVLLRSLCIGPALTAHYQRYFDAHAAQPDLPIGDQPLVLVNVRTHNKSLLNLDACIDALLERLGHAAARFLFEGSKEASALIGSLCERAREHGCDARPLLDADIFGLYAAVRASALVIVPIGSGLVVPTWILPRPCLTFADPDHLTQIEWWHDVAVEKAPLDSFDRDEIATQSSAFYASYRIEPECFAERTALALQAAVRLTS